MKKKWIFPLLIAVLALLLILAVLSAGKGPEKEKPADMTEAPETTVMTDPTEPETDSQRKALPESVLYYGEILKLLPGEEGKPGRLSMESPKDGPYIMNLSEETFYLDSGERKAFDPEILAEGDRVYVFMSPISARSMPPQTQALAVVRNIPMDASCPMYHKIKKLENTPEGLTISTDQEGLVLRMKADSQLISPEGEVLELSQLQEGSYIMAWYWNRGEEVTRASHVMLLPERQ